MSSSPGPPGMMRMPARFLLALAANPCPCGRHGTAGGDCECRPSSVRRYRARLSGPLLDRVDLRIAVEPRRPLRTDQPWAAAPNPPPWSPTAYAPPANAPPPATPAPRGRPTARSPATNCAPAGRSHPGALAQAERDLECGLLTARGLDRVLRVAWTAADLAGRDRPTAKTSTGPWNSAPAYAGAL